MSSMNWRNGLSMESSFTRKALFAVMKAITQPRSTLAWVFRGHLAKDPILVSQTYWFTGTLPRVPVNKVLPGIEEIEVLLPRTFDRKSGTSINAEEACHLGAIMKCIKARKALEIGTYDGNTALVLAANMGDDGTVVTVDLPPDFSLEDRDSLRYSDGEFNLTPRDKLGRQYKGHDLAARIHQVYGDSGQLNWDTLGGPFDLVFIDGCHSEEYVRSDSENAIKHLAPGGVILWHDYGMIAAVSNVVDRLARETTSMKAYVLEGTRLAIGLT
jgi:predicted O-methyltransferase YrrM